MPVNNTVDFRHRYERLREALTTINHELSVDEAVDGNIRYTVDWTSIWPGIDRTTNTQTIKHTAEELYDVWDECSDL